MFANYTYEMPRTVTHRVSLSYKVLIYFALRLARYWHPIYSWKYGCELEELIVKTYDDEDCLLSETKRMIEDAFLINPHIKSVEDVAVNKQEEKLNISCTVNTKYGDIYIKI